LGAVLVCATATVPTAQGLFDGPRRWPSDETMHRQFVERFESAVGLGRARMISPNLRVQEGMELRLVVPDDEGAPPATLRYLLKSLELIGIAKHREPVAFVIDTHTARSGTERTRALDTVEQRALVRLRAGSDVEVYTTNTGRRVVGAIRATAECTSCHSTAKPGDILGAISYRLTPVATTAGDPTDEPHR
jgi:hypothetical protein